MTNKKQLQVLGGVVLSKIRQFLLGDLSIRPPVKSDVIVMGGDDVASLVVTKLLTEAGHFVTLMYRETPHFDFSNFFLLPSGVQFLRDLDVNITESATKSELLSGILSTINKDKVAFFGSEYHLAHMVEMNKPFFSVRYQSREKVAPFAKKCYDYFGAHDTLRHWIIPPDIRLLNVSAKALVLTSQVKELSGVEYQQLPEMLIFKNSLEYVFQTTCASMQVTDFEKQEHFIFGLEMYLENIKMVLGQVDAYIAHSVNGEHDAN